MVRATVKTTSLRVLDGARSRRSRSRRRRDQLSGRRGSGRAGCWTGLPGGIALAFFADAVAGAGDRYPGALDGELDGLIAAWDRVEAHAAARKHAAIAEFIRRRPEPGYEPEGLAGCRNGGMSSRPMSCGWCWPSRGPPPSG